MGVSNHKTEKLPELGKVDVEIGIFHVESREPGSLGKGRDNQGEHHHPELEFLYKSVEHQEVQDRAEGPLPNL